MDMSQSNYLLNIRLEADNATLVWSRPAWDIANAWTSTLNTAVNVEPNSETNNEAKVGGAAVSNTNAPSIR